MGFAGALTILFVALKLTGVIDWAWYWVFFPLILQVLFMFAFIISGLLERRS